MHNIAIKTAAILGQELTAISALVCEPMRAEVPAVALGDATRNTEVLLKME